MRTTIPFSRPARAIWGSIAFAARTKSLFDSAPFGSSTAIPLSASMCTESMADLPLHVMVVNELIRLSGEAHLADEWTVQGNDDEQDHSQEAYHAEEKKRLEARVVHLEEQAKHNAAHRAGKQHEPEHTRKPGFHRVQPLTPLLYQLVERMQDLGLQDFLRFGRGLEREQLHLKAVHPFDALARDLPAALLRPGALDDLLGIAAQQIPRRVAHGLRVTAEVPPQAGDGGRLARHYVGHLRVLLPHADRGKRCNQ